VIKPESISSDNDLARRVLVRARDIAPCIDSLDDESTKDAIAILKGVVAEIPPAGTRRVRSRGRNGTSITYADFSSAFSDEDVRDLRSLCKSASSGAGPVGSFPKSSSFAGIWPEGKYS